MIMLVSPKISKARAQTMELFMEIFQQAVYALQRRASGAQTYTPYAAHMIRNTRQHSEPIGSK
jgi:hypothetical protein